MNREKLAARWAQTFRERPGVWAPVFDDLWERYREPHRYYHTVQHLEECFDLIDASGIRVSVEAELAVWYHDVVFDTWPGAKNEAASAALADRAALRMGFSNESRERVRTLILATQVHTFDLSDAPGWNDDHSIVFDVDLAILGADRMRFAQYEQQIRVEYDNVSAEAFRRARYLFITRMLDRQKKGWGSLYYTPWFKERFEDSARTNLECSRGNNLPWST